MIRIKSFNDGFRRCGIAHPAAWTDHADDEFTAAQLERLKSEPMLRVETVKDDTGPASAGGSPPDCDSKPATGGPSRKSARKSSGKGDDPDGLLHD